MMLSKIKYSDLFILFTLFCIFFMTLLGSHALLNPDEGRYSEIAREMLVNRDYITPYLNGIVFLDKPILFYWLEVISLKLFGLHEWSLRLWPALFAVFGCLIVYVSGCFLFNRRTGILSSFILSTTTLYFLSAHYVNMDLEVAVLITAALFSFMIATQYNYNKKIMLLAYIFSALAILTKGLIGIVIPALVICLWGICLKKWRLLFKIYLPAGFLLIFMLVLPWYFLEQRAIPEFFHYFFIVQHFSRFLSADFNGHQPVWFYLPIILIGFFPWTIFLIPMLIKKISSVCKEQKKYAVDLFLIIWVCVVFLFFSMPSSKIIGYILPIFPPIALLVGSYLDNIWNQAKHWGFLFFIFLIFFMGLSLAGLVYNSQQDPLVSGYFFQENFHRLKAAYFYFYAIAGLFVISGIIALFQLRQKTILGGLSNIFITMVFLFFIFLCAVPKMHLLSTKPLAMKLSNYLKPNDIVVTYHQYYQDLPLYLQRRVIVVDDWDSINILKKDNWRRELWGGSRFQALHDQLISDRLFAVFFRKTPSRFFIFTDPLSFRYLVKIKYILYEIDHFENIYLLSNKKN